MTDPKDEPQVALGRTSALPQQAREGVYRPLSLDQAGRLRAILKGAVEDGVIPADALQGVGSLPVEAFTALWNATAASWDRMRSTPDNADGIATGSPGLAGVVARALLYDSVSGAWDRAQSTPDNADGIATGDTGLAGVVARALLYDSVSGAWDRARSTPDNADGIADGDTGLAGVVARTLEWNGATWDRARPRTRAVNSILAGLTTAAAASEAINIDLGLNFDQYRIAMASFLGSASTTNDVRMVGSNDNVSFFYLTLVATDGLSSVGSTNAGIAYAARIGGFRYLRLTYVNGSTAQTNAALVLSAQ